LYRRYRPETFSEVIGQDHVTVPLRNALSNNRVNHAYLFSGPRGCGKTTSARILARAINCEKGPIAEPCGVCKSCTDLARGGPGSIDVIEIDAASHGGVDDARDLRERAFFAPVESRYKIYIIDEAHMVTTQGFNALLKLVEEPPPHLKFIFATTEPDKVIGTIRSRTHHYPFRLVPPKVLGDYMASLCQSEGVAIESAALPLVVRAGAGSVRDSLSVLDQLIGGAGPDGVTYELAVALLGFTPDSLLDACVDGIAAHDSRAVFETIEKVIETGQDPKRFAEDLLRRLRDLVILSAVPTAVASGLIEAAEDQGERLQTQAAGIGPAELTRAADIVAAGLLEMRGATAPRLQLELICAKVLLPGADDSTNGIQARLDRMERRLTIGVPAEAVPQVASAAPVPSAVPATDGPAASASASRAAARAAATGGDQPAGGEGQSSGGTPSGPATADAAPTAASAGGPASRQGAWADESASQAAPSAPTSGASGPAASAAAGSAGSAGSGQESGGSASSAQAGSAAAGSAPSSGSAPSAGPAASGAPAGGAVGLADIRRLWPEVLEAVKAKRRFAWIMLSQNAQVIAIDDQTLTLGLVNAGARESFARSGSDEILRQAMIDTIGLNRRIEAVVDPSTDPGAGGQPATPRPTGPTSGGTPAPSSPAAGPPAPPPSPGTPGNAPTDPSGAPGPTASAATTAPGASVPGGGAPTAAAPSQNAPATNQPTPGPNAGPAAGPNAGGAGGPSVGGPAGGPGAGGPAAGPNAGGPAGGPSAGGPDAGGTGAGRSTLDGSAGGPSAGDHGGSASGLDANSSGPRGSASSPGTSPGGPNSQQGTSTGPSSRPGSSDRTGQWSDGPGATIAVQEPPDSEYDVPPEPDPWDDGPAISRRTPTTDRREQTADRREQASSKRRAAEAAVAAEQARRAAATPAAPEVALTPEEEADSIGEDDLVLEDDSRSHTDLLRETLGAQIITEEPN